MARLPQLILGFLLAATNVVVACQPREIQDCHNVRDVLDSADCCLEHNDSNGACRAFVTAYDVFANTAKNNISTQDDQERFLFEGGDRLLTYAKGDATTRAARISAAANAEKYFQRYVDWFSALSDAQIKALSNGGRICSVLKFLGDTLIAQERKIELPETYSFLFTTRGASVFGPEAMRLWEQSLKDTYGAAKDGSGLQPVSFQWQEFAQCLAEWAKFPGMLKASVRERYLQHSEQILGKLL